MMRRIPVLLFAFFVMFLFVVNFPSLATSPDYCSIYIYTPYSNQFYSSMVNFRIVSSDHFLNQQANLQIIGNDYQISKKISIVSPIENIYQDVTKFPIGEYECYMTEGNNPKTILSNTQKISVKAEVPLVSMKDWSNTEVKKVNTRNITLEALTKERLKQVSLLVNDQVIKMEDYGTSWKWNGIIPLKKGLNDILVISTNSHNISSRQLYKIQLEEEKFAKKIPILVYHNIGYMQGSFNVTPDVFEMQLKELVKEGCYFTDPAELQNFFEGKVSLPEKTVMITFDDGYRGIQQYALPILEKFNIKATIFVVTGFLGNISFLNWDQLDEIAYSDLMTIASHTNNLHYYKQYRSFPINYPAMIRNRVENESVDAYQTRILNDLLLSKKILETRYPSKKIDYLAYPFGAYNQEIVDLVRKAGFKMAFAYDSQQTKWMSRDSNPFLLERYPIFQYSTNKDLFREER